MTEQSKETDRRIQEAVRRIHQLKMRVGRLGNQLGDFVEGFVEPAVVILFQARGLPVHQVLHRLEAIDDNLQLQSEVDFLVIDSDSAVPVECKSHAGLPDVREHLAIPANFKRHFPRYAAWQMQGALAVLHRSRKAQRFTYRQGSWVLAKNDRAFGVENDDAFQPRVRYALDIIRYLYCRCLRTISAQRRKGAIISSCYTA